MSDAFYPQYQLEIDKLRDKRGEPLLQQIQRIIDVATEHDDLDAAAGWYRQLLKQASQQGRFNYELAAFAPLRRLYEGHEKFKFLRETLLWYYKWVVERLPEHADISQELIDSTFAQMIQFYKNENESLRPVHSLRCRCESFMGHKEKAAEYKELWENTDSAKFDDCPACQTHARVQYLLDINQVDDAIKAAEPILAGKQHCDEVPSATFSRLLLPMAGTGKIELAERMQRFTQRHVRKVPKMLSYLCNHVAYLSLTGRPSQANRLAAVMLVRGSTATNTYHRLCAWRAGWTWLAMRKRQGESAVRLPAAIFGREPIGIDQAIGRCRDESFDLAEQFDRRNGNTRFTEPLTAMETAFKDLPPK